MTTETRVKSEVNEVEEKEHDRIPLPNPDMMEIVSPPTDAEIKISYKVTELFKTISGLRCHISNLKSISNSTSVRRLVKETEFQICIVEAQISVLRDIEETLVTFE